MSKIPLTVFVCTGKECRKAWHHHGIGSVGKWLKRLIEDAGLPYKLRVIKTECMDRCEQAACLCCVSGDGAGWLTDLGSPHDADRVLATFRSGVESNLVPQER